MKRISLILIVIVAVLSSCDNKKFDELNIDSKHPTDVPGNFIFANAQKALADQVASTNVNLNNWKLFAQYWTETTYTDEANYDIVNRTVADLTYRTYYRDILRDFQESIRVISEEAVDGEEQTKMQSNRVAIADILMVYCYNRLVDMFGNIPYGAALDIDNISPVYEDAFTIYKDLLNRLDTDLNTMNANYGSFGSDDLYFGGDVAMWVKFAHTLKVKMGVTLSTVDAALAKSTVEGSYDKIFGPGELCELIYEGGVNSNPLYQDLVQSGRDDFVAANTIVDVMNDLQDPRRPKYFTDLDGEYIGGDYGYSSAFSEYSHVAPEIEAPDYPITLLDYTEACFYLAEAAERGMSVGGSAEDWYNNGITESMNHWGVDEADASAYLSSSAVAYGTAAGDWKQKIGTQAWLAAYVRGFVGYTSYRRLGWPTMNIPPNPAESADGNVPRRMTYPINEQTLNADNYYSASDAIGGDRLATKLFWDK